MKNIGKEIHGGNVYKVFRERGKKELLDYSSNINPYGVPESLVNAINNNINELTKYPDPEYIELRNIIAEHNNLNIENIVVGNGATEIIFLLLRALNCKNIIIVSPTFAEYERAINSLKIENDNDNNIKYFELEEFNNFEINIEKLFSLLNSGDYDTLILCNPNNPTGTLIESDKMLEILKCCNANNVNMIVDEAFIEFVDEGYTSLANIDINKDNLYIFRAFTKFFAIPGLRLGYGIVFNEKVIEEIYRIKEPWTLNTFSSLAGKVLLEDKEYIEKTIYWIKEEKLYMYEKLNEIYGIKAYSTNVNFILCKINEDLYNKGLNSKKLRDILIDRGILIRDASNFIFLDDHFFRLAIKDRHNNNKVLNELENIIKYFQEINKFHVISINYKKLDITEREEFIKNGYMNILEKMFKDGIIHGYVSVETCLRIEIYIDLDWNKQNIDIENIKDMLNVKRAQIFQGDEALKHLLEVICGLDSIIKGEDQILSQVKKSYLRYLQEKRTSSIINIIFNHAIETGKKFRNVSKIAERNMSLDSIAIKFIEEKYEKLSGKTVFVIGVGELSQSILSILHKRGNVNLLITNRSNKRSLEIKRQYKGVENIQFLDKYDAIERADVIISATAAPHFVVTKSGMEDKAMTNKKRVFLDLAVPRDVDISISNENTMVYHLEDIWKEYNKNVDKRNDIVEEYMYIINEQFLKIKEKLMNKIKFTQNIKK